MHSMRKWHEVFRSQIIDVPCGAYKNWKEMQPITKWIVAQHFWKAAVQCHRGIALPLLFISFMEAQWNKRYNNRLFCSFGSYWITRRVILLFYFTGFSPINKDNSMCWKGAWLPLRPSTALSAAVPTRPSPPSTWWAVHRSPLNAAPSSPIHLLFKNNCLSDRLSSLSAAARKTMPLDSMS